MIGARGWEPQLLDGGLKFERWKVARSLHRAICFPCPPSTLQLQLRLQLQLWLAPAPTRMGCFEPVPSLEYDLPQSTSSQLVFRIGWLRRRRGRGLHGSSFGNRNSTDNGREAHEEVSALV